MGNPVWGAGYHRGHKDGFKDGGMLFGLIGAGVVGVVWVAREVVGPKLGQLRLRKAEIVAERAHVDLSTKSEEANDEPAA